MPENKPQRLSEVLDTFAPQGANDARWFLVEHQLKQVTMSARAVVDTLTVIRGKPENEDDRQAAEDCTAICVPLLTKSLEVRSTLHSYLSGTEVPERISRKEL